MLLIVDDDDNLREALTIVVEDAGYPARSAANGEDALRIMREEVPRLVLLDVMMPKMSGLQLFAAMKADPLLAAVPVCMLSAVSIRAPVGVDCVLTKPVTIERLLEAVRKHF